MAQLFTLPKQVPIQSSGAPWASAKLYFYRAGTTTDQNVYTDAACSVAHSQPVQADANGIFAAIYLNPNASYDYRVQLKQSDGTLIYDQDNVPRLSGGVGITSSEQSAGVTPTNYTYLPGDVRRYGAAVDGTTDDTSAWTNALLANDEIFLCSGTHVISSVTVGTGKAIRTQGFGTIVQQKSGQADGTRMIVVTGSNVVIQSMKTKGNIATDTNGQMHSVFVYNAGGNITNVRVGDIYGENVGGDVLYIGAPASKTTRYVTFGTITGKNIYRNVVSIVNADHVRGDAAITDTSTGYVTLDIEPDNTASTDIYVGMVRGAVLQCAPPTSGTTARRIEFGLVDLDPALAVNSTPSNGAYSVANAVQLRNTVDLKIGHLKIRDHTGLGVNYIFNVGETKGENIIIGYLDSSGVGSGESTYNCVLQFQNVTSATIDDGDVSLQAVGDYVVLGDSSANNTRLIVNRLRCNGTVVRYCKSSRLSQITINTANAVNAFRDIQDSVILDSDITIPSLVNNPTRVTFVNVNATCSTGYSSGSVANVQTVNCNFGGVSTSGNFTLGAAVTTTVNNANVTAASRIVLVPTNAAAATLMGSVKSLYVSARTNGVSFAVSTANAVAAAGTETFDYSLSC